MSFTNLTLPDKLYYDITISNLDNNNSAPPNAYFNETRQQPFVSDPQQYYMSIIRFTLDTPTLPIFIPEIKNHSTDLNDTIYSITLEWTNPLNPTQTITSQKYIQFIPQDQNATVPLPPSATQNGLQNNGTGYYFIYSYQYWIYLCNLTFQACFDDLVFQANFLSLTLPTTYAPVLTFDTQQNIAILNSDLLGYDTTNNNCIYIYFNSAMLQLFSSFPYYIETFKNINGKNFQIQTNTFGGSNEMLFPPTNPTYTVIQTFQEYSTTALWSPIVSIVFCSNTLPIVPNQVSTPLLFYNGVALTNGGNNSNISQVITDIVSDSGMYKPNLVYNPTAQYRLIELLGNRPLYNLDIEIFWKDRTGGLNPLKLSAGSTATVKFLFTRRDNYSNYK